MITNFNRQWQETIDQGGELWLAVSCQGDFFEFYIKRNTKEKSECLNLIATRYQ